MLEYLYPLLVIVLNCIYIPAVWYGLVSDDASAMKLNPYNIKREKTVSMVLHAVVSLFIYYCFGIIPALLFSIHPITIQISSWRSGQPYGLSALLFLFLFAFPYLFPIFCAVVFINCVSNIKYEWQRKLALGGGAFAILLFTPLAFTFTDKWYLVALLPIVYLITKKDIFGNVEGKIKGDGVFNEPLPEDFTLHKWNKINLIIVVKTFGFYALSCLLPIKNGFYNSFLATVGSSKKANIYWYSLNRHFWGGLLAIISMVAIWAFNIHNHIGMGIMLFVLSIGPFLNFITVQQWTAPRYCYLALIGFQVALTGLLFQLGLPGYLIISGLFVFYLDRMIRVRKHYAKDNMTMFDLDSQVFPDNPRIWYFRYEYMLHKNNPVMAWAEASYGLKHLPEDCQLWFGLACASYELGDLNAASKFLAESEKFMLLTDRRNMQELILEFRKRIQDSLEKKWYKGKRRF